jgi:predicted porin
MEAYETRFAVPRVGNADTFSYYAEVKYKFTPQFFGAVRWNQQTFGTILHAGSWVKWGRDTWRIDVAPSYRLTPHLQLKLQYSLLQEDGAPQPTSHTGALQVTTRF